MKFIIDVPQGYTRCNECPFTSNYDVCYYCAENRICTTLDFTKLHIEEYEDTSN